MAVLTMPENTPGGISFERGFLDDISGLLHKQSDVSRDLDNRLVLTTDMDEPDREHFLRWWASPRQRAERNP